MSVVFGLLFLPAAISGTNVNCWSATGGGLYKDTIIGAALLVRPSGVYPEMGNGRPERKSIRLVSRQVCPVCCLSVMFRHSKYSEECVVLGCSVPARCGNYAGGDF